MSEEIVEFKKNWDDEKKELNLTKIPVSLILRTSDVKLIEFLSHTIRTNHF